MRRVSKNKTMIFRHNFGKCGQMYQTILLEYSQERVLCISVKIFANTSVSSGKILPLFEAVYMA